MNDALASAADDDNPAFSRRISKLDTNSKF